MEIKEINKNLGGKYTFRRGYSFGFNEPTKLYAFNKPLLGLALCLGSSLGAYCKIVKRYSWIWLMGGFLPFLGCTVHNLARQPDVAL